MPNSDQIAYWTGGAGDNWANQQVRLDNQLMPLGNAGLRALAVAPGEVVVDIGCGSGQTTVQIAEAVGPEGRAIGLDISTPMLAIARARAHTRAEFVEADAQVADLAELAGRPIDAVFSRFGVMFFEDPVAAFANMRRAMRPGGRLAFVCWRPADENPVMTVPMAAAAKAGVPMPANDMSTAPPDAPGPFAFADRARVADILATAGWTEIVHTPHDERVGGNDADATLELAMTIGPLGRLLREAPQFRDQAVDAVRAAIAGYAEGDTILMPSATWIVTARAPS